MLRPGQLDARRDGLLQADLSRRGGVRSLNTPNWEDTTDQIELQWDDLDKLTF
jgi:hypothetical protein